MGEPSYTNIRDQVDDFYISVLSNGDKTHDLIPILDENYFSAITVSPQPVKIALKDTASLSSSSYQVQVFCKICMETVPADEVFQASNDCPHVFCGNCLSHYIGTKIIENIFLVRCPEENCKAVLEPEMCQDLLPCEVFKRWKIALSESMVLGAQKPNFGENLLAMQEEKKWSCPQCKYFGEKRDGCLPPIMHRAEKKYVVSKICDKEEAKQRQFRAILNKLMPQNFDRLFKQVIESVYICSPNSLAGLVSQIFDRAVQEPTYCEIYADLCSHITTALPDFIIDNKKITFRVLLLNKCQEEFQRKEREEAEACKTEEDSEAKQTREERAEKRLKARRRAFGTIQLIGELYKRRMLTEQIMHECIRMLLGPSQNPDEEDIEALCKLMTTIGEMIDHPKAKEHMDACFDIMKKLSMKQRYSSRIRFMLKDIIDLRKNKWRQQGDGGRPSPRFNVSSPRGEEFSKWIRRCVPGLCQTE